MRRRRWGRVLWMVPRPEPSSGAEAHFHAVAAAALPTWLRSVAAEVAADNVTLNVLEPPPARAPGPVGAGEVLSASEVAAVAAFLLSERARGWYGSTIRLGAAAVPLPPRPDGSAR